MNLRFHASPPPFVALFLSLISTAVIAGAQEPATKVAPQSTLHPALFIIGDSIVKTGRPPGDTGPWGWGSELAPLFDTEKIHVYNKGRGGRSSRGYIDEGLWANVLEQLEPGDFVIIHFGHNDARNSRNYPDRVSVPGSGDETQEIESPVTHQTKTIHTYGWYLRQYINNAKARGATPIVCSSAPRNTWIDGKIKRGFDGYAQWAADAARSGGAFFIDLNNLAADRYDALGQEQTGKCFSDNQHTTKAGARVNAESVVEGLKQLSDCPLTAYLAPAAP